MLSKRPDAGRLKFHAGPRLSDRKENRFVRQGLAGLAFLLFAATVLSVGAARAGGAAQKSYQAKCAACHGADGKGDTGAGKALGAHDFSSPEVQKMSDAELAKIIANGRNKMPPYGKTLSAADIKSLVEYIRGFAKK